MKTFYTILLFISSLGFIYGGTRKDRKKKIIIFILTAVLIAVFSILIENS